MTDPRVARGMGAQLARRRALLAAGHASIGWKIGLTLPAVQRMLGLAAPVVGFVTRASTLAPGAPHSLAGGTRVALEAEIAIHLGAAVAAEAGAPTIAAAIVGLGPAFELVDLDRPFDDLEAVVAGNVFHRAALFGPTDPGRAGGGLDGVRVALARNGAPAGGADAAAACDPIGAVRFVAAFLAAYGAALLPGDRILAGSLTPPVPVGPGDVVTGDFGPLGRLALAFTA